MQCPCKSGKTYEFCCKKFHDGMVATDAKLLMRSRYAAYAMGLSDYIIRTTHPKNPQYNPNFEEWAKEIQFFSENTDFQNLEIVNFNEGAQTAIVTFIAHLKQHDINASFKEKSLFEKVDGRWLYREGRITPVNPPAKT